MVPFTKSGGSGALGCDSKDLQGSAVQENLIVGFLERYGIVGGYLV